MNKDYLNKKAKKLGLVAQENTRLVLGTTVEHMAHMVVGESPTPRTNDGCVTYKPVLIFTHFSREWLVYTRVNTHLYS